jgi:hypothetical protein
LFDSCCVTHSCFSSSKMNLCKRCLSESRLNLLVINLHFLRIMFDIFAIRMRYRDWVCSWFKWMLMKATWVSLFSIAIDVIRKTSNMLRKQRFCMTTSLFIVLDFLFLSICQTKNS